MLLGNSRGSKEARARASAALHNIIHSQPDDKRGRREIRVLHLLEQIRVYCETCWEWQENHERGVDQDKNPSKACSDVLHALVRVWLFGRVMQDKNPVRTKATVVLNCVGFVFHCVFGGVNPQYLLLRSLVLDLFNVLNG